MKGISLLSSRFMPFLSRTFAPCSSIKRQINMSKGWVHFLIGNKMLVCYFCRTPIMQVIFLCPFSLWGKEAASLPVYRQDNKGSSSFKEHCTLKRPTSLFSIFLFYQLGFVRQSRMGFVAAPFSNLMEEGQSTVDGSLSLGCVAFEDLCLNFEC